MRAPQGQAPRRLKGDSKNGYGRSDKDCFLFLAEAIQHVVLEKIHGCPRRRILELLHNPVPGKGLFASFAKHILNRKDETGARAPCFFVPSAATGKGQDQFFNTRDGTMARVAKSYLREYASSEYMSWHRTMQMICCVSRGFKAACGHYMEHYSMFLVYALDTYTVDQICSGEVSDDDVVQLYRKEIVRQLCYVDEAAAGNGLYTEELYMKMMALVMSDHEMVLRVAMLASKKAAEAAKAGKPALSAYCTLEEVMQSPLDIALKYARRNYAPIPSMVYEPEWIMGWGAQRPPTRFKVYTHLHQRYLTDASHEGKEWPIHRQPGNHVGELEGACSVTPYFHAPFASGEAAARAGFAHRPRGWNRREGIELRPTVLCVGNLNEYELRDFCGAFVAAKRAAAGMLPLNEGVQMEVVNRRRELGRYN